MKIEATFRALACYLFFSLFYYGSTWYATTLPTVPSFFFSWEQAIPFLPWMIVPYMSSGILFVLVFFFCENSRELRVLTGRILFVTSVSALCFVILPLKFSFIKPNLSDSIFSPLFGLLSSLDQPYNQFPSLHVSYALIFWFQFRQVTKGAVKWFLGIWLLLLGVSTLTVYQHHFIDIPGGIFVAILGVLFFPIEEREKNITIAWWYYLATLYLSLLALLSIPKTLPLLYPALSLFLVGVAYQQSRPDFLQKKGGKIPLSSKILFGVYLIACWLMWRLYGKRGSMPWAEIVPGVFVGRRLSEQEARSFVKDRETVVIDLVPELEENVVFRETDYLCFPMQDLVAPKEELFKSALVSLINTIEKRKKSENRRGQIYIHCTMGYSRSIVLIAAYLILHEKRAEKEVLDFLREKRPQMVLPSYFQALIKKLQQNKEWNEDL